MTSRPALVVAAVATGWGTVGAVVRQLDLPAGAIVAGRARVAALALGAFLWCKGDEVPGARSGRVGPKRLVAHGVILAAHWVALVAALQRAPIGTVLLVSYLAVTSLAPVFLVLVSESPAGASGGTRLAYGQPAVAGAVLVPVAADWGPPRAACQWLGGLGLVHTASAMVLYVGALASLPASGVLVGTGGRPVPVAIHAEVAGAAG